MQERKDIVSYREDLEERVDFWQKEIDEKREKLWWFTLVFRCFLFILALGIIALILGNIFALAALQTIGGISLFISVFTTIGFISYYAISFEIREHLKDLSEAKHYLAKFLKLQAEFDKRSLNPTRYKHALPNLIDSYRRRADRFRNWYICTQIVIIILSATVTSLAGGWLDRYIALPWTVPVLSGVVSILTSVTLFFRFREKGANLQQTADEMDLEYTACSLGIGDYKGMDEREALTLLIERAEALRKEQQQRQQQLEQSSQAEQKALQPEGG